MSKIRINVKPNSKVEHVHLVSGKAKGPVNLWVLSNDGMFYLQPPVTKHGNRFTGECKFGFEEIGMDSGYEIWAVESEERPHSPQPELPAGDKAVVRVWREK